MAGAREPIGRFGYAPPPETACYTSREWAWEFMRPNKPFQEAWQDSRHNFTITEDKPNRRTVVESGLVSKLSRFGLRYSGPPCLDALSADVFWAPEVTDDVLRMYAICRRKDLSSPPLFRLETIACSATRLIGADGVQHILFREEGRMLQLQIAGASLEEPVYLFAQIPATPGQENAYLRAVHRFRHLLGSGHLLEEDYRSETRNARLSEVLQALKLSFVLPTHRAIAIELYGKARVDADWTDSRSGLREHVRRLIQRGRDLVEGEYRNFLT